MMSSELLSYHNLFKAWKEELTLKQLTSLPLNFIKSFLQNIDDIHSNKNPDKFIQEIFVKRVEFLTQNLINLRKNKILNSILSKEEIPTSYLSKQELLYYDYLKSAEKIIQNKPLNFSQQIKEFILQNSNLKSGKLDKTSTLEQEPSPRKDVPDSGNEGKITVVFLTDLEAFVYHNNQKFGPFKKNEEFLVPKDVFNKILKPKKIAIEKE